MANDKIGFRTHKPQKYWDSWRNKERVCNYVGKCVNCGSTVYEFEDGENDPRGILTERHANSSVTADMADLKGTYSEVPACFKCMNEEDSHHEIMRIAKMRWASESLVRQACKAVEHFTDDELEEHARNNK